MPLATLRILRTAALAGALTLALSGALAAATYRIHIIRLPDQPTPFQVARVWMSSDTVFGETAGVEYLAGSTYTKVLGTFDTSGYPTANWRADIPFQAGGTNVSYQLFTRNQSGQDYGFTGFNWSYQVQAPVPAVHTTFGRIKQLFR